MTANYYIIPGIPQAPKKEVRVITFDVVLNVVSIYTGLSKDEIIKKCRKRERVFARHLVCYLALKFTQLSLASIGEPFGQDHTTVIHGNLKIKGYLDIKDPQTCEAVETIENLLRL
jgi:chromosomal replication initiator protein